MIVTITVVPLATLLWLGWRLLEQDRVLERQQIQQRVDTAAPREDERSYASRAHAWLCDRGLAISAA